MKPRADDTALYALAQVRASMVVEACEHACKGCPGPGEENGCETREWPKAVAGRADWPMCPYGMLRAPTWQAIRDEWIASRISPIANFPDCLVAFAYEGICDLQNAVRREDERKANERTSSGGGPVFTGRRVTREA